MLLCHKACNLSISHIAIKDGTLIKKKTKFPHILGNLEGSGAKSYMTNDLLIYGENICAFSHILGSPYSYMTLHPIQSEFSYI
jgi:hypothetical protein